jgi:hypothetical protein
VTPDFICRELTEAGLHVRSEDGLLLVSPMSLLTKETRQLLQDHKLELIAFLQCETLDELLAATMRACDHHGDDEAAREAMRADCLATPMQLRLDLLHHFEQTYGAYV